MYDATGEQIRPRRSLDLHNPAVATVDDDIRVLTTHIPGTATLYCETFDKKLRSNSITIEVVDIEAISLEPETVEVPVG